MGYIRQAGDELLPLRDLPIFASPPTPLHRETPETAASAQGAMACRLSSRAPVLVGVEARDGPAIGPLVQERNEIGHEGEFPIATFAPAEAEWLHQVGQLFSVKNHSLQDGIDEGRERLGRQAVGLCKAVDLLGLLLGLELLVTGADSGLVKASRLP